MATKQKRISQEMANNAARKMRNHFFDEKIKSAAEQAAESIEQIIERYVPSDMRKVIDFYEEKFGCAITNMPSLRAQNVTFRYLPFQLHKKYQPNIILEDEDLRRVQAIIDDFRKVQNEATQYEKQVESILLQLKTPSKVKEIFPEAIEFIQCSESAEEKKAIATVEELRKLSK